ncbi:MAG: TonB-dependent receptor [Rikenellaceae bacterium]
MRIILTMIVAILLQLPLLANNQRDRSNLSMIVGEVRSSEGGAVIQFATISVAEDNRYACISDENGRFKLRAPLGEQTIVVSFVGYEEQSIKVAAVSNGNKPLKIRLVPTTTDIERVVVRGESQSSRTNRTAFNVQSVEIGSLKNSSANITQAMSKMSGVNLRESGGVGSDTELSINGFTGNHVKIFIDGIPQNGNAAFSLNNIPAGFAERIEMYSGVVPIEFGADALGGVVNIITNKAHKSNRLNVDASYSYGSFNTHKTYLNFSNTIAKSGFTYSVTAYQNYSDNNYDIDNYIVYYGLAANGNVTRSMNKNKIETVERFHDQYHNETVIGAVGFENTSWADHLTLKLNYSQYYKDVQTGTTQEVVYGEKYSEGTTLTPTLEYSKRDLFTSGLDVRFSANFDTGHTHNADPATESYNWLGDAAATNLTPTDNYSKNRNWSTNFVSKYVPTEKHSVTISNTLTSTSRASRSLIDGTNLYSDYGTPQQSRKSISGLSYLIRPIKAFEGTIFAKHYYQSNQGTVTDTDTGVSTNETRHSSNLGYGAAATYFILPQRLQSKVSYERAYRLPTSTEMFGDTDLEVGTFEIDPETSDNININLVYTQTFNDKHFLRLDGSLIYRNTYDYIMRSTSSDGTSASYKNYGQVKTKGYSIIARYDYDRHFSIGGTFNSINPRDAEKYETEGSEKLNITYNMRVPNQPYLYGNGDATFNYYNLFSKHDQISLIYDVFFQNEFTLYWEEIGYSDTKAKVPTQLSHNITLNYSFRNNRYNLSFEARNITNEKLYDNYSLQKAGRAFYGKFRVNIFK